MGKRMRFMISAQANKDILGIIKQKDVDEAFTVAEFIYAALEEIERHNRNELDRSLNLFVKRTTEIYFRIVLDMCVIFYRYCPDRIEVIRVLSEDNPIVKDLRLTENVRVKETYRSV